MPIDELTNAKKRVHHFYNVQLEKKNRPRERFEPESSDWCNVNITEPFGREKKIRQLRR